MGDFVSKYNKVVLLKDRGNNAANRRKFNRQQDNNAIVNSSVGEILLQKINEVLKRKHMKIFNLIWMRTRHIRSTI